jgi:hypothetical protein
VLKAIFGTAATGVGGVAFLAGTGASLGITNIVAENLVDDFVSNKAAKLSKATNSMINILK